MMLPGLFALVAAATAVRGTLSSPADLEPVHAPQA